jgi:hypothetical protein
MPYHEDYLSPAERRQLERIRKYKEWKAEEDAKKRMKKRLYSSAGK